MVDYTCEEQCTEMNENGSQLKTEPQKQCIEREKWSKGIEFVLSGIGFAVGLGNIWRFPYLCYKNGGGIGYGTTVICFLLNTYYIIILAWAFHYFVNSFNGEPAWGKCNNPWNTDTCFNSALSKSANANRSNIIQMVDPVVEYWERKVLGISKGIDDVGDLQWELAGSLLVVWILVYLCVRNGIKTSGKVVYFTAIFPYFMLTVLLVRGVTLDGASEGIKFYLKPDFSKLGEAQVWIDAGTQIFFSYAIALGCMTALGSYNEYNNNFIKDCIFISVANSCTSLYSGLAVFSVLGFMAKEQGVPIADVAESGPGLVFLAYPKAITQMKWAPVWSVLFFFMIILMGLDSQFVGVEGFVTAIVDLFPSTLRNPRRKEMFILITSIISYCIGLTMVTNGGMYVFQVFDYYAASGMVLLWFCFFESIVIAHFYGVDKFYANIAEMIGYKLNSWLRYCWLWFTPALTMGILLFSTASSPPLTYNRTYTYPKWALAIGWTMALVPMMIIPVYFFSYLLTREGISLTQKWKAATRPILKNNLSR
ncbi:sodium- and chloride-dependent taurine transporter-like isoform X2 [Lycorma delicatula]|uniref:sodium- and chloride-dependent taurine transporter-like isoform X2 n=1 Tax=Lycorma delicatula TaxID=130591 RepID=UPI003F516B78